MPLVLILLGMFGVVSAQFLSEKRRIAAVLMSIAAAVLTPSPDWISMLMLLAPMLVLYEVAVVGVRIVEKKRAISQDLQT